MMVMSMPVPMFCMCMLTHDALHLSHRNNRQIPTEQREEREEQTKASDQHTYVNPSRRKVTPTRRQEISTEGRNRNHKPLEPHTDVHENRNDPHGDGIRPKYLNQNSCGEITLQLTMIQYAHQ